MNLSVLARQSLPAVLAARSALAERLRTIAAERTEAESRLADDQGRLGRRQGELHQAETDLAAARARGQTAEAQFQSGEVLRGAYTAAQDVVTRLERKVRTLGEQVAVSQGKVDGWNAKLRRLAVEQAGIDALLGIYGVLVTKKEADLAWQDARVKLMHGPGAEAIFAAEMGEDAAGTYELSEQINRLQADRAHRVDKLRRFVMAAPEGFYRTEHDLYPARVLEYRGDRYLVYVQASPRYFYDRKQVAELLGRDPEEFAPEYTRIDRRDFEYAVRQQRVRKGDGSFAALDEVVPLRQMEFSTSQVNVRKLGPTEDAKLLMYHPEVGNRSFDEALDPVDAKAVVDELNNVRDEQDGSFVGPEWGEGRPGHVPPPPDGQQTPRLRHLAGVPRKVLQRTIGTERANRLLGTLFGRPLE
jgi:hypothetical protein